MENKSLVELSAQLQSKALSSVALTEHYLSQIEQQQALNSFITVTAEQALATAKLADQALANGNAHPLTGIPVAHKDLFCTDGVKTSCGSKYLDNFVAPYNATVVQKFADLHMPMLGKTNMDEFGMGSTNERSHYGACLNPWNTECVAGGSSGGSAVAVAAGLAPLATGSDTGGSIRQPASFNGITGIKPTYGRVSRWGMVAYASSLDQGGVMAQSAEDCALALSALAGFDDKDSTSMDLPVDDYMAALPADIKGLRIGIPKEYFADGLDPAVDASIKQALSLYESLGAELVEVSLPNTHLAIPAYYVIAPAEASSNLSRFDGVRYGYRCDDPVDLEDLYKRSRSESFGAEVQRRIMIGTYALSAGYYDAYYIKAQKIRRLVSDDFSRAFESVDLIAGPTAPKTAYQLGEMSHDPVSMYLSDIYTIAVNLSGLPGMSLPVAPVNGMPVGLQLIGPSFAEARLLNAAHQFQQASDWHLKQPS